MCGICYSKKYDGYVFVDAMGNIFNPRSVTANFSKLLEQNGLRHIRFHDLRHSCTSLLLANDVPLKQTQGSSDSIARAVSEGFCFQIEVWKLQESFTYFKIFKPISWGIRPADRRSRFIQRFPKYIAKHGMPKMRFHDLRHSCASLLLANGVPLKQIQEWLGHSDFSTTANIYAHLDYRSKISSAQAMEQGMLLPRSDDFGSRWENVTEQGKITEPDLNPVFD